MKEDQSIEKVATYASDVAGGRQSRQEWRRELENDGPATNALPATWQEVAQNVPRIQPAMLEE